MENMKFGGSQAMRRLMTWICLVFTFAGGIYTGWVNFNNTEPQAAVLVILGVTFVLGLANPRKAWLLAVIVPLWLPGIYWEAHSLGYQPVTPSSPGWYASLPALIPAFIAAFAGALVRVFVASFRTPLSMMMC